MVRSSPNLLECEGRESGRRDGVRDGREAHRPYSYSLGESGPVCIVTGDILYLRCFFEVTNLVAWKFVCLMMMTHSRVTVSCGSLFQTRYTNVKTEQTKEGSILNTCLLQVHDVATITTNSLLTNHRFSRLQPRKSPM